MRRVCIWINYGSNLGYHFLMCDTRGIREADSARVIWTKKCILSTEPATPVSGGAGICLTVILTICLSKSWMTSTPTSMICSAPLVSFYSFLQSV